MLGGNTALDPALHNDLFNMFKDIEEVNKRSGMERDGKTGIAQWLTLPYVTRDIAVANGTTGYNVYAHALAGMTVQFILLMGIELGVGLLLMRRMGLWQRLGADLRFPEWLQSATRFVPTRWAIDGFDAMTWRAQPLQAVVWPTIELLGLSVALSVLAIRLFKREE